MALKYKQTIKGEPQNVVTLEAFEKFQSYFFAVASGIVLVLFVAMLGLMFATAAILHDSYNAKQESFQSMRDQSAGVSFKLDAIQKYLQTCNARIKTGC